ncbi:MAG TPA: hypothetical protein VNC50_07680 [Planctomycetia bacterium]|nr:hypothetical protein [Planctomycetia bacterium]
MTLAAVYALGFAICLQSLAPAERRAFLLAAGGRIIEANEKLTLIWVHDSRSNDGAIWDVEANKALPMSLPAGAEVWLKGERGFRYEAAQHRLIAFDPRTGREVASTVAHLGSEGPRTHIKTHPDGEMLFNDARGGIVFWNLETGSRVVRFPEDVYDDYSVSNSGRYLHLSSAKQLAVTVKSAAAEAGILTEDELPGFVHRVGDASTGMLVGEFPQGMSNAPLRFSPDDRLIAGSSPKKKGEREAADGAIEVRSLPDFKPVARLEGSHCGGFDREGRLIVVAAGERQTWRLGETGPVLVETRRPIERPAATWTANPTFQLLKLREDGSPWLSCTAADAVDSIPIPDWAPWVRAAARRAIPGELFLGKLQRFDADGRVDSELSFFGRSDPEFHRPVSVAWFAADGSRTALVPATGEPIRVFDLPFRRRWLAIATWPFAGVATALAARWLMRATWRFVRRGTSREAAA